MYKSEKIIKKVIFSFSCIAIALFLGTLLFDYFDLKKYFPLNHFTAQYDWLGIIGAIIGGLIGAIGTYIGIYLTIKNEREENKNNKIEERKRNGYSYLIFSNNPMMIKISWDSIIVGNLDKNQNILIGENVKVVGANYFDIELYFKNINNNYPTAVMVENMKILYDSEIRDNNKHYNKYLDLYGYQKNYNPITIKNDGIVAFQSLVLINKKQLSELKQYLLDSKYVDIITNIRFINANGVETTGNFRSNLIKYDNIKLGRKECLGTNKEKIYYKSENTYLTIKNIDYIEECNEMFGNH